MNTIPMLNKVIVCFLCALTINGAVWGEALPAEIQEIYSRGKVTIEDVKTMNDAGVTDGKIIDLIQSTNTVFYLTPADVAGLKKAGVSERVIDYMQQTPYQKPSKNAAAASEP